MLIAQQVGASQAPIDGLALGFVGARLLYGICYLSDQPSLRSVAWQIGMLCIVGLFVVAAL